MIYAAMPFVIDQGGKLFSPKEPGFHLINNTLKGLGEKTAGANSDTTGLDAIPSCAAHLIKMHSDMQNESLKERYCEERWRKVMLIYVLSKYRGYDIAVSKISMKSMNPLVQEIIGKKLLEETQMGDSLFMLQYRGYDIAVFDRRGYLLPVAQFPADVDQELGENCIMQMEEYERGILWTFLKGLLPKTMSYKYYIVSFISDLDAAGAKKEDVEPGSAFDVSALDSEDILVIQKDDYFYQIPSLQLDLPQAFHSKLILSNTDFAGDSFGRECTFYFQAELDGNPFYFSGLLPLSETMVDFLQEHEETRLEGIDVDDSEFLKKRQLTIKLTLKINNAYLSLKKSYSQKDICIVDSVPMVTIYPYVDLPKKYWRQYYIVLKKNGSLSGIPNALKEFGSIKGENIDILQDSISCASEAERAEARQSWFYASCSEMPSFIKLCISDFDQPDKKRNAGKKQCYIGCVCVGKPPITRSNERRTYYWALDMGTRNTIAAWRNKQERQLSYTLARNQLYCPLLAGMGNMGRDFARECYAPIQEVAKSFTTMVRIYKAGREGRGEVCYEDGCALFSDLELISGLLGKDMNWEKAAIFTDIKFGENDQIHETALQIFLHNMLWLGSLECILNGADELKIIISYPRNAIRERIGKLWGKAVEMVSEISDVKISLSYCLEAEANARYLQKKMRGDLSKAITKDSIFGICDIGDGTSDFNLYLGTTENEELPARIQFSMRYAGRDILVETIMRFSEKYPTEFEKLWHRPADKERKNRTDNLISTYEQLLKPAAKGRTADDENEGSVNVERGEAEGTQLSYALGECKRNIVLALIENAGMEKNLNISPIKSIKDFAAVLTFKYWNLFHVFGDMLDKFTSDAVSFKLFVYGGGRKALKFATGKYLDEFKDTEFGRDIISYLSGEARVRMGNFSIDIEEENAQKTEVVEGMLEEEQSDIIKNRQISGREDVDRYFQSMGGSNLPERKLNNQRIEDLLDGYQKYIQDTQGKEYFKLSAEDVNIESIYEGISVGAAEEELTETEKHNRSLFTNSSESIWYTITEDKDNPSCLWEVLFYTKMSNYLLEQNIW